MTDASTTRMEGDTFVISKRFAAPRATVYAAWTEAEQLQRWFGPKGFTMPRCSLDLRVGGTFLYGLQAPDGSMLWGKWVFRDITPPERIVVISSFSDEQGGVTKHPMAPEWPLRTLSTTTFEEDVGRTIVTVRWQPYEPTDLERRTFIEGFQSMTGGWGGTFERLDADLAQP